MTITQPQLEAISGYLQRIGFTGYAFDPNDRTEAIHNITPPNTECRFYSFKPASHPNVINGGHMFTYGVTAGEFDAIITAGPSTQFDKDQLKYGLATLKPRGLVVFAFALGNYRYVRAVMTMNQIAHIESLVDHDVVVGEYLGGA